MVCGATVRRPAARRPASTVCRPANSLIAAAGSLVTAHRPASDYYATAHHLTDFYLVSANSPASYYAATTTRGGASDQPGC